MQEGKQFLHIRASNMKVCHTLICFCFLSLQDGNTGVISAEIPIITGKKGGNVTVGCQFNFPGETKIFCKEKCEGKDILIKTGEDRAQNDRYSIEYRDAGRFSRDLYVSITNLTKSDSGRYRCGLERFLLLPDSMTDFELRVEDAPTILKPTWTLQPPPTSAPSAPKWTTTTKESLTSSPGSSTPSSSSPETTNKSEQHQTTKSAGSDVLLYAGLTLGVLIIVLIAALLIFCRKRNTKPKGPPEETEYANVKKANQEYEEIGHEEDRQSRSPRVEISTVSAKYTKPHAAETSDEYSLVTAVNFQQKSEDASNELIYSQVDFSGGAAASLNSAPRSNADNVIYSAPRVGMSSDSSNTTDASPPLYSTVTVHQL